MILRTRNISFQNRLGRFMAINNISNADHDVRNKINKRKSNAGVRNHHRENDKALTIENYGNNKSVASHCRP